MHGPNRCVDKCYEILNTIKDIRTITHEIVDIHPNHCFMLIYRKYMDCEDYVTTVLLIGHNINPILSADERNYYFNNTPNHRIYDLGYNVIRLQSYKMAGMEK